MARRGVAERESRIWEKWRVLIREMARGGHFICGSVCSGHLDQAWGRPRRIAHSDRMATTSNCIPLRLALVPLALCIAQYFYPRLFTLLSANRGAPYPPGFVPLQFSTLPIDSSLPFSPPLFLIFPIFERDRWRKRRKREREKFTLREFWGTLEVWNWATSVSEGRGGGRFIWISLAIDRLCKQRGNGNDHSRYWPTFFFLFFTISRRPKLAFSVSFFLFLETSNRQMAAIKKKKRDLALFPSLSISRAWSYVSVNSDSAPSAYTILKRNL